MAFCDCVELFILNRDRESDRFRYRFHWVLYLFYWSRSLSVWKHRETMNKYCFTGIFWLLFFKTRMHSSRMRTARSLPYWGVSLGPYRDPRWTETLPDRPPRSCDPRQTPAGQRPRRTDPPRSCDLWCMLGQRPPLNRMTDRRLWKYYRMTDRRLWKYYRMTDRRLRKYYLAATSLRAVITQLDPRQNL